MSKLQEFSTLSREAQGLHGQLNQCIGESNATNDEKITVLQYQIQQLKENGEQILNYSRKLMGLFYNPNVDNFDTVVFNTLSEIEDDCMLNDVTLYLKDVTKDLVFPLDEYQRYLDMYNAGSWNGTTLTPLKSEEHIKKYFRIIVDLFATRPYPEGKFSTVLFEKFREMEGDSVMDEVMLSLKPLGTAFPFEQYKRYLHLYLYEKTN